MPNVRSQITFNQIANVSHGAPVIQNNLHWQCPLFDDNSADEIALRLTAFYDAVFDDSGTLANYVSNNVEILLFNIDEPSPRVPIVRTIEITPGTTGASVIPAEVACVCTYNAAPVSGVDRRRLHNRIYLGGLGNSAMASTSGQPPAFSAAWLTDVAAAWTALVDANDIVANLTQRSFTPTVTNRPIVGGWIDANPDTQRRRGAAASSLRYSWTPS